MPSKTERKLVGKALECEACDDDHDGMFDVLGLFTVEVCGRCTRDLRHALFHYEPIVTAIMDHKSATMFETIGGQVLNARIQNRDVDGQPVKDVIEAAKELIICTRRGIYDAVMAWCADHKKTEEAKP